jgi:hypothetical protein
MTVRDITTLQALFEQGDTPTGTNYADMIESAVNRAETSAQSLSGPLSGTEFIAPIISAGTRINAPTVSATNITVSNNVSAVSINAGTVSATNLYGTHNGPVKGATTVSATNISTNDLNVNTELVLGSETVAGSGSTQGTANQVVGPVTFMTVTSAAQGVILQSGAAGRVQYLINTDAAVTAKVYPSTDGVINALATNAAFDLLPSTKVQITRQTSAKFWIG